MSNAIVGPPNMYPAGSEFDYSVWTPGTIVDLVNVPWSNSYKDVVRFADRNALNSYIDSKAAGGLKIEKMTYAKPGHDILIGMPFNRVNRYNYLRASNPLMPQVYNDIQKDFYYFILECEYVNAGVTRVRLQLDLWQTYVYDMTIGNCYVTRGHIGIANQNAFQNYGRDYLTVPEGQDIGADYQIVTRRSNTIILNPALADGGVPDNTNADILVLSTVDLDKSTIDDSGQAIMVTATGSTINGLPSGADVYVFKDPLDFQNFISAIADKPWMTQGVISATLIPALSRYSNIGGTIKYGPDKTSALNLAPTAYNMFQNWRNSGEIINAIPARYRGLKKFFTFPYMAIELTTFTGNPAVIKPELWNDDNATIMERFAILPPGQRIEFIPRGYNAASGSPVDNLYDLSDDFIENTIAPVNPTLATALRNRGDDSGEYLDLAVRIVNLPQLPIVNNMAIGYLAANRNQISYGFASADWSYQRAMAGAQASYDISNAGIAANTRGTGIGNEGRQSALGFNNANMMSQAGLNALSNVGGGAAGGMVVGPGGAAAGAVAGAVAGVAGVAGAAVQVDTNTQLAALANDQNRRQTGSQNQLAGEVRDTNMGLANYANSGDYANALAAVQAKVRDAALTQPSVSGQFGGDAMNIEQNKLEFSIRFKMLDYANMRKIGEYWLRFGYAIGAFIRPPQNLMVMNKFTYWEMKETYITAGNVPESHKQGVRGILEKGVTVWANPDDMGNIDMADNLPLGGISY